MLVGKFRPLNTTSAFNLGSFIIGPCGDWVVIGCDRALAEE
jgi:hypothetical protein